MKSKPSIYLVRVITDDGVPEIWLAATPKDEAVDMVLDAIPEGWTASLVQQQLSAEQAAALNMKPGEVRKHQVS